MLHSTHMKVLIATPLYPPDTAEPAPYSKELATRLSARHEVTIITYGCLPEAVEGVQTTCASKRLPRFVRLMTYTRKLFAVARRSDVVYLQNGSATELPAIIVTFLTRTPVVLYLSDTRYQERLKTSPTLARLRRALEHRIATVLTQETLPKPLTRPEILPLEDYPTEAISRYERSWHEHLTTLESHLQKLL